MVIVLYLRQKRPNNRPKKDIELLANRINLLRKEEERTIKKI